ncbi:MAG: hypothetical protein MRJ68_12245 [Nitrospira sp.]|nr:hypothetical protein [Nitrospira sp.]
MAKSILQHLKLKTANCGNQGFLIVEASHNLDGSLLRHLSEPLVEGLALPDIGRSQTGKDFRLKLRQRQK